MGSNFPFNHTLIPTLYLEAWISEKRSQHGAETGPQDERQPKPGSVELFFAKYMRTSGSAGKEVTGG